MSHLLILRPTDQALPLQQLLQQRAQQLGLAQQVSSEAVSLLEIIPEPMSLAQWQQICSTPYHAGLMVSASAAQAVQAMQQQYALRLPKLRWFAVGPSSAAAIAKVVGQPVVCPWRQHNSEALLALPELQQVAGQRWLLVRGRGGRELLAETLLARGAEVDYVEVYQRTPVAPSSAQIKRWQQQVRMIMVSSAEQLSALLAAMPASALSWLANCQWLVASDRLAACIPASLANQVVVAESATASAMVDAWQSTLSLPKETSYD